MNQHGPSDSMEDWIMNFGVQIDSEELTPQKMEFCEIPPSPRRGRHQKHALERNSEFSHDDEIAHWATGLEY